MWTPRALAVLISLLVVVPLAQAEPSKPAEHELARRGVSYVNENAILIQLLGALKASSQWHKIPVVMITTEGGETKVGEAVRLGAAGYVRKPFTADQIKEKLVGILEPAVPL